MQLTDIYLRLGEERFGELLRSISIGRLKTFQLFERVKTRLRVSKLNSEALRKCAPKCWARINDREDEFATELGQAILISHMDMIQAVLNHLGIPHEEGFFAKDADVKEYLKPGWERDVWEKFHTVFPSTVLLFYVNHLAWEILQTEDVFAPAA
jgi:hypothetical protein